MAVSEDSKGTLVENKEIQLYLSRARNVAIRESALGDVSTGPPSSPLHNSTIHV